MRINPRSSVGKSERVLIARSMVRVHPGKLAVRNLEGQVRPTPARVVQEARTGRGEPRGYWCASEPESSPAALPFETRGASMLDCPQGGFEPRNLSSPCLTTRRAPPYTTRGDEAWGRWIGTSGNRTKEAATF